MYYGWGRKICVIKMAVWRYRGTLCEYWSVYVQLRGELCYYKHFLLFSACLTCWLNFRNITAVVTFLHENSNQFLCRRSLTSEVTPLKYFRFLGHRRNIFSICYQWITIFYTLYSKIFHSSTSRLWYFYTLDSKFSTFKASASAQALRFENFSICAEIL